jgi:hypothetical protein
MHPVLIAAVSSQRRSATIGHVPSSPPNRTATLAPTSSPSVLERWIVSTTPSGSKLRFGDLQRDELATA